MDRISDDEAYAPEDDETSSGLERRFVHRLLTYWRNLSEDEGFPSFDDVDPASIPDMWPNVFVLETLHNEADPIYHVIGSKIASHYDHSLIGKRISLTPPNTLFSVAVEYVAEVLAKQVPISRGGQYFKPDGTKILYRSILLPMSDDGKTISGILGAANCRESERD
jgi:hypothetical protein